MSLSKEDALTARKRAAARLRTLELMQLHSRRSSRAVEDAVHRSQLGQ